MSIPCKGDHPSPCRPGDPGGTGQYGQSRRSVGWTNGGNADRPEKWVLASPTSAIAPRERWCDVMALPIRRGSRFPA